MNVRIKRKRPAIAAGLFPWRRGGPGSFSVFSSARRARIGFARDSSFDASPLRRSFRSTVAYSSRVSRRSGEGGGHFKASFLDCFFCGASLSKMARASL